MAEKNDYYVYVYVDPRNFEEFYYGKGRGSRKEAHMADGKISDKVSRIQSICEAGLSPIIRVIAKNLSESNALLVEKTLLWRLGKSLTNVSTGHYADNFRPRDTMHTLLAGFDFNSGIYYYNVGQGNCRNWNDYVKYGFISAGQGPRWRDAMLGFQEGDVVAAYLKTKGFVGIGIVTARAQPIKKVQINSQPLLTLDLECKNMNANVDCKDRCEYVALVKWIRTTTPDQAKWKRKSGIFTTQQVRASIVEQHITLEFLNETFEVNVHELMN